MSRLSDGAIVKTYTINQGQTSVINGQYDWVNNRIALGSLYNNGIYSYDGLIQRQGLDSIDTDGFFTLTKNATLASGDVGPFIPTVTIPDRTFIDSPAQFK